MDFTISEVTGLFTMPFLMTMGENAYNIMNELGLIFIPFTIVIFQSFLSARSQGADEGAASIIFIKTLETRFIPMFLILLLAVMPSITSVSPNYKFVTYQCAEAPSILYNVDSVENLKPNTNFSNLYGDSNAPMIFGFVNELGAVLNGAGIAALNCSAGSSRNEAAEILSNLEIHKAIKSKAVKEFDRQCYSLAMKNINRLQSNDESTVNIDFNVPPYNTVDAYAYDSPALLQMYDGTITSPSRSPMLFVVPDYWSEIETGLGETATCSSISSSITNAIKTDLYDTGGYTRTGDFDSKISQVYTSINTTNGESHTLSEAMTEMTRAAYRNTASDWYNPLMKRASVEKTPTVETRAQVNSGNIVGMTTQIGNSAPEVDSYESGAAVSGLAYFGAMWSNLSKSIETLTYLRITPVLSTIAQGAILSFGGIILLLSGYSSRVLMHLILLYFSLAMLPFFMNVGIIFDTVITGLVENKSNGLQITNSSVVEIVNFASTTIMILCPLAWLTLVQVLGIHASNSMDLASAASAADQATNKLIANVDAMAKDGIRNGSKGSGDKSEKVKSILNKIANEK